VDAGPLTNAHRKPVRFPPRADQVVAIAPDDAVLAVIRATASTLSAE
jgi:hypothetical protein